LVYPDAGHAFANEERPTNYHQPSADAAWERALAFLHATLG
jgi:dienelactone hydrolase